MFYKSTLYQAIAFVMLTKLCSCEFLNFSSPISFQPLCNTQPGQILGNWSVEGLLTFTPDDLQLYQPQLYIQTTGNVGGLQQTKPLCEINITDCDLTYTASINYCACLNKTGNVYLIGIHQEANISQSGLTLQAVLRSSDVFDPTTVTTNIGVLPTLEDTEPHVTYTVDGRNTTALHTYQTTSVCGGRSVLVELCVLNSGQQQLVLSVLLKNQSVTTNNSCVDISEVFDFSLDKNFTLEFTYQEIGACLVNRTSFIDIFEKTSDCDPVLKTTISHITTNSTPPTSTQAPPPSVTFCLPSPASQPRELETLPSGLEVLCDTETEGGGWVIFQRRNSTSVPFTVNWQDYAQGFGDLQDNFWLGLTNVHNLCNSSNQCQLRLDITTNTSFAYAQYDTFYISGEQDLFRLHVDRYSGTAPDNMLNTTLNFIENGMAFTTQDRDNDLAWYNCAEKFQSGWWFNYCYVGNLNLPWGNASSYHPWRGVAFRASELELTEMKLRPKY